MKKVEKTPKAVGMALYYFTYSTWQGLSFRFTIASVTGKFDTLTTSPGRVLYLEDIFIDEEYRRYGIGSAFFKILAQEGYIY